MSTTFRFDVAFGPGDALACGFYDPRRHLSTNLPNDLKKILQSWNATYQPTTGTDTDATGSHAQNGDVADSNNVTPAASDSEPEAAAAAAAKKRTDAQEQSITNAPSYPKIHSLAFGSRGNESALVFREGSEWFIGKTAAALWP